jgi:hypothetical protein
MQLFVLDAVNTSKVHLGTFFFCGGIKSKNTITSVDTIGEIPHNIILLTVKSNTNMFLHSLTWTKHRRRGARQSTIISNVRRSNGRQEFGLVSTTGGGTATGGGTTIGNGGGGATTTAGDSACFLSFFFGTPESALCNSCRSSSSHSWFPWRR